MVPRSLKAWFLIHFAVDYAVALPLMVAPGAFLRLMGWQNVDPLASRLVAAALVGVGGVSLLARDAQAPTYRALLDLKLLWSGAALLGIALSILGGAPSAAWLFLAAFGLFFALWAWYRVRLR